jgi:HTH-type transcriptional regulator/antitoxin HigA
MIPEEPENQVTWLRKVPTKELIRRGFLKETSDRVSLLEQSLKFFGVASVEAWNEGWSDGLHSLSRSWSRFEW